MKESNKVVGFGKNLAAVSWCNLQQCVSFDIIGKSAKCFGFSTRSLGHVMFRFAGTGQLDPYYHCSQFIDGAFFF